MACSFVIGCKLTPMNDVNRIVRLSYYEWIVEYLHGTLNIGLFPPEVQDARQNYYEDDSTDESQVFDECHGVTSDYVDHGQQTLQC